jgi:hypothetical protein
MSGSLLPNQTSANVSTNFFAGIGQPIITGASQAPWLNPEIPANTEFLYSFTTPNADIGRYPSGWYLIGMFVIITSSTSDCNLNWGFKLTSGDVTEGGEGTVVTEPSYQNSSYISSTTNLAPYNVIQIMYAPSPFNNVFGYAYNCLDTPTENTLTANTSGFIVVPLQINGTIN